MLGNISFIIKAGVGLALAGVIAFQFNSNRELKLENREMIANSAILNTALIDSKNEFNKLQSEYEKIRATYEKAVADFAKIDGNTKSTQTAIDAIDFSAAQDVAVDVNKIYRDAMRCIELASGAELTNTEKEAKDAESFNPQCPWIYSNNVADIGLRN